MSQFRKIRIQGKYSLQIKQGDQWRTAKPQEAEMFIRASGQAKIDPTDPKPFAPKSYRDFMLYERHYINAARNYAKTNMPMAYRFVSMYEKLTGKVHAKLKPPALWYQQPIFYMGGHMNFFGEGAKIVWPQYSGLIDYEAEIGFVLAKPLFNASPDEAEAAIGGFVVFNDLSARDVQMPEMRSGFGPQKSKHFANAISSYFVTADEILPQINSLSGHVTINDHHITNISSNGLQFSLGEALAHVSNGEHLYPGEFFATGTLPGGCGLENGHWLAKGDKITISITGIGEISNRIV